MVVPLLGTRVDRFSYPRHENILFAVCSPESDLAGVPDEPPPERDMK
jgi:hypothetical protein